MASQVDILTIASLKIQLCAHYLRMGQTKVLKQEEDDQMFIAPRKKSQCRNCGRLGHNARNCYKDRTCEKCGKKGHIEKKCYKYHVCDLCHHKGHTKFICYYNDKNAEITPQDWIKYKCDMCQEYRHHGENCYLKSIRPTRKKRYKIKAESFCTRKEREMNVH